MKVVKVQSKKTYTNKDGKEKHYYNYYLVLDNGCSVPFRTVNLSDRKVIDAISEYRGN